MLIDKDNTAVVIFDMQLELIPLLLDGTQLLHDCCWLAEVSREFDLPLLLTNHKKLGDLSVSLLEAATTAVLLEKEKFDFLSEPQGVAHVNEMGRDSYVLAGAETHVVIFQSALSLLQAGKSVFLLRDTCSARSRVDHEAGIERLAAEGAQLITREMFFFELIRNSEDVRYLELARKYLDGRYIR